MKPNTWSNLLFQITLHSISHKKNVFLTKKNGRERNITLCFDILMNVDLRLNMCMHFINFLMNIPVQVTLGHDVFIGYNFFLLYTFHQYIIAAFK